MFISQNDPEWKLKRINGTTYTIGGWGCLITDIAWILQKAGYSVTPDTVAKHPELFETNSAMWNGWNKLETLYPKMKYAWGERCTDYPAPIDKIIKELDDGFFPIIMLDYAPKTTGIQTHYLTCIGHDDKGNIKVGDPIDGQEVWLDARYGEQDEKYKILKVDVYHFTKPIQEEAPELWDRVKGLLTQENNFSEADIREMVDWYKLKDTTERKIKDLNEAIVSKQNKIGEKDGIISDLKTQIEGIEEKLKHDKEFLDKLSDLLNCSPDQGEVLASTVVAISNESKLASCQANNQSILKNMEETIKDAVEKTTFELRLKLAELTIEMAKKDKDIISYQKKIESLSKPVAESVLKLKIQNFFNNLFKIR